MGASNPVALGTFGIVLIATMAWIPAVSADIEPVSDAYRAAQENANNAQAVAGHQGSEAQKTADEARRDTERRAGEAQSSAVGAGEEAKQSAERAAAAAIYQAEGLLLYVLDLGMQAAVQILDAVDEAIREMIGFVGNVANTLQVGPKKTSEGGFHAQASEYAIARPFEAAPLMWIAASAGVGLMLLYVARRLLAIGVIPLLSRIARSDLYNNEARRIIHDLVVGEPGQCLNELVGRTGYSRNAVSYHLFVLEKEEEIVSVKDGKYRRYFARNGKYVNGAKNVVAALRNGTTLRLAQAVVERPGLIQRDLCVELGATPSATCWHAKRLLDLGVIRKERVANTVKYYPGDALAKYDLTDIGLARPNGLPSPQPSPGF